MPEKFNNERAAAVLLEALYSTDEKAATKYGVSVRSIQGWRKRLTSDPVFAGFFATKKRALDAALGDRMSITIRKALDFIDRACQEADPRNPGVIEAINGSIKIISEAQVTGKFIDARIGDENRAAGELPGQGDAPPQYVS